MQGSRQDASATSASVSPTQIDFVKFLQKCANSPHLPKKHTSSVVDGSAFTSPELLADTLLNWDAGARLGGADNSETASWPALRVLLQQQGFPHDSLPQHMPYSSHADTCVRGILGDVLVQYSLRGQLVQQLIDTVEFASMHDSHVSIINGSNASAAHELSRTLETKQFRNFEEAAVQRATEQSLRQQLRQVETDLQSSKERNRQLRSQVSDLEEEVHLMTRQLSKLRGNASPTAAPSGNGRWEPPQVPLFKSPPAASSPMQHMHALVSENDSLKQELASVQALYEELRQSMDCRERVGGAGVPMQHSSCSPLAAAVKNASVAVETEGSSKLFTEEMFRIFSVADKNSCVRVARATQQLANTVPHLQAFAADVSAACAEFSPGAALDTPEQALQALRAICTGLSELSTLHGQHSKSHGMPHLEQRSGLAVVSVAVSDHAAAPADSAKARGNSETFDGSNLVFFTGPHSEDSLATSPLPQPPAQAPAPAAAALSRQSGNPASQSDASAAIAEAMALVGCTRPEELLISVEHLLVQSDELQHLRAVLSRRLDLTDPCATYVDAELGARDAQSASSAGTNQAGGSIRLHDPDDVMLQDFGKSGDNQRTPLDSSAGSVQHSLAWDIVMHPARRPKPNLTSKPIAVRSMHAQPIQTREKDASRKSSSQNKQQRSHHAEIGFSQQLFANFKRRLMSQHSAAASELLSVSRKQSGQHVL